MLHEQSNCTGMYHYDQELLILRFIVVIGNRWYQEVSRNEDRCSNYRHMYHTIFAKSIIHFNRP